LAPAVGILKRNIIEKFQSGIPHITGRCMNDCITSKTKFCQEKKLLGAEVLM
jgi:hypothetical protein